MLLLDDDDMDLCRCALAAYEGFDGAQIVPFGDGHTHKTYLVERVAEGVSAKSILQRVNPIRDRAVHDDIEAITTQLQSHGMVTPCLFRSRSGELSLDMGPNGVWRLMSFVPGRSYKTITPGQARSCGSLIGSFHAALAGLHHEFRVVRSAANDLEPHALRLRRAFETAKLRAATEEGAELDPNLARLVNALLEKVYSVDGARLLSLGNKLPLRLCHGDFRASKLRFNDLGKAVCLLGFDTLAWQPLPLELGDALRLWCNPSDENNPDAVFDLERFASVLAGYAESARQLLSPSECSSLVSGIERMTFQCAVRYTADLMDYRLADSHRPANNFDSYLIRVESQMSLYRSVVAYRSRAESFVTRLFRA